jgi:hypothetical protein
VRWGTPRMKLKEEEEEEASNVLPSDQEKVTIFL